MEKTITLKRMTRLGSIALPAVMACTLAMPAFAQTSDQGSQAEPGRQRVGKFHGRHGREWRRFRTVESDRNSENPDEANP